MELINQVFDYSQVDTEDKGILIKLESDIVKFKKRSVKEMLDFGGTCEAAHEILSKYGSGQFSEWIEVQGVSRQTAYNAMSAKSVFGVCPNLDKWEVSAMYALAKNGEAKKKALKLASKGVAITHSVARQLIEEARPEPIKTINHDTGEEGRTDSDGMEPQESAPEPPRNGTDKPGDFPDLHANDEDETPLKEGVVSFEQVWNDDSVAVNDEWEDVDVDESVSMDSTVPPKPEPEAIPDPRLTRNLANQYRDKLARAICDYHELVPNRAERNRLVKLVQGVELW